MALFFDCDNDGYKDLFVVRFGQSMIFRNRGDGTFEDVTPCRRYRTRGTPSRRSPLTTTATASWTCSSAVFSDVDLTNVKTTRLLQESWETARNGGSSYLLHNVGGCRFVDRTREAGVGGNGWTLAVATADIDADAWLDLGTSVWFGADIPCRPPEPLPT